MRWKPPMAASEQPCQQDCPFRCVGCHGQTDGVWNCEKWGEYQERRNREREEQRKGYPIEDYVSAQIYRNRKRKLKEEKKHG